MKWTINKIIFNKLAAYDFKLVPPPDLMERIRQTFVLSQTKVIEDAFGQLRDVESRGQKSKR
eukprot:7435151-Prorocentrum_lima.AAC.1